MSDTTSRLKSLGACAVSDALDALGIAGHAPGLVPMTVRGSAVAGRVVTVQLGPSSAAAHSHLGAAAVDSAAPGDVIVVANGGRTDCAGWGGLLSAGAKARGVEAVVVDGAARDIDEAQDLGLPVFARAATPTTARGRVVQTGWGEPIRVGGTDVSPGDWMVADGSGVVFVPGEKIEQVLQRAARIADIEEHLAEEIQSGREVTDVMDERYELMLSTTEKDQ